MSSGTVSVKMDGAVAQIVFANPDEGFMDRAMEEAFLAAIGEVEATPAIRACVLSGGTPGVFIRHYDLKVLAPQAASMAARGMTFTMDRPVREGTIHQTLRQMEESQKIYIAALNGTAMGGGFETAIACDLRIVEEGAYEFGLPEINLGILPGAGGTQRLPQLVGLSRALRMTLTGDTLGPDDMVGTGLAISCVPDARAEALVLAHRMAAKPARAAAHIKRLIRLANAGSQDGHALERTLFCDLMVQQDAARLLAQGADGSRRITDDP
ncbi:enoyl-CoA hydratase/isomerase family protein [Aestuariivita sp.]|jgi:enoyl-CoA hydratase|uniref:enoyl-CoA hydratase/isomerase family protein n=1 Tax=Aestuariivita sp. TaxID=1872407 RepID=UPI00216D20C8|nr:enoyl-CoA hydratase/isomerase family protein [Aestuariivita sp.]MCE8005658.1 enoyl-CoA hydratase/isomerase family protein [Aestuariivita sp.]